MVAAGSCCQDCGEVKATTFKDLNDGGLYCQECWIQFYGSPPLQPRRLSAEIKAVPKEIKEHSVSKDALPEDAPRGHPAHSAVRYEKSKKVYSFRWRGGNQQIAFQTTVPAAAGSQIAAEVIARACYMKFEQGWTKDKILEWRNQCYARLGGRAPSLATSQAASQRGRNSHAPATPVTPVTPVLSRSAGREHTTGSPSSLRRQVDDSPPKNVKPPRPSRTPHEGFLPPQHLKLLLDDPQAPLPKNEVKIRSQGYASQAFASQRASSPPRPAGFSQQLQVEKSDTGHSGCCSCRVEKRRDDPPVLRSEGAPKAREAEDVDRMRTTKLEEKSTERDAKRKREDDVEGKEARLQRPLSLLESLPESQSQLPDSELPEGRRMQDLLSRDSQPESQHRPETQPTPAFFEPPVPEAKQAPATLPTPAPERPTPLPESQPMPVTPVKEIKETLPTPWCTQPTPKVDMADHPYISDPTPSAPARDVETTAPALSQPTPFPQAPDARPQEENPEETGRDGSFPDTAVVDPGETAAEGQDSAFPSVSLDVVTALTPGTCMASAAPLPSAPTPLARAPTALAMQVPTAAPVPSAAPVKRSLPRADVVRPAEAMRKPELGFASLLLQRSRAAGARHLAAKLAAETK
ncbi:unnamed protein product [Effrenium voratum]|nr:unnamed protein product [Effrenium voratum]